MNGHATGAPAGVEGSAASSVGGAPAQAESQGRKQVSRDAWLWENDEHRDGTLYLVRKSQPADGTDAPSDVASTDYSTPNEAFPDDPEPAPKRVCVLRSCCAQRLQQTAAGLPPRPSDHVSCFKVHKTVYSSASGFFKACFARNGTPSVACHGWPVWCPDCQVSTLTMSDPELEVAQHVFKFIYTLELPTDAQGGPVLDPMQLVWVIQVAEYLDVPACIKACAESLCALSSDHFPISAVLHMPSALHMHPAIRTLLAKAHEHLHSCFGDAPGVMQAPTRLARLCELSPTALLTLLRSPLLTTDSESSVVVLTAIWHRKNRQSCSDEQLQELRAELRLGRLPVEFICRVLQHLSDFSLERKQLTLLWMAATPRRDINPTELQPLQAALPASFFLPARPTNGTPLKLQLKIRQSKLRAYAAAVAMMRGGGAPPKDLKSAKVFGFGYNWELALSSASVDQALALRVVLSDALCKKLVVAIDCSLKVEAPKPVGSDPRSLVTSAVRYAWPDVLGIAEVVLAGDQSPAPWAEFMVDGYLCFEVEVVV